MARGPESKLQAKCMRWLRDNIPRPRQIYKISDRNTRGIPDTLCVFFGRFGITFLAVEFKSSSGKLSELQRRSMDEVRSLGAMAALRDGGGYALAIVVDDYEYLVSEVEAIL